MLHNEPILHTLSMGEICIEITRMHDKKFSFERMIFFLRHVNCTLL
jgi:hypothetical protein